MSFTNDFVNINGFEYQVYKAKTIEEFVSHFIIMKIVVQYPNVNCRNDFYVNTFSTQCLNEKLRLVLDLFAWNRLSRLTKKSKFKYKINRLSEAKNGKYNLELDCTNKNTIRSIIATINEEFNKKRR